MHVTVSFSPTATHVCGSPRMRRRHPVTPSRPAEGHWRLPMTMAAFRFVTTSRAAGREEHPQGALNSVGPWPPKRLTDGRVQRPRERHRRRTLTGQRGNEPAAAVPMRATPARQACSQFPRDGHGPEAPAGFPCFPSPPAAGERPAKLPHCSPHGLLRAPSAWDAGQRPRE